MKRILLSVLTLVLATACPAFAEESSWLEIGGDYRFRYDMITAKVHDHMQLMGAAYPPAAESGYDAKNNSLMLNRFGVNLKANALEDVTVKARLVMYKVWGQETMTPVQGGYFTDRAMGTNDGTIGHVPSDNSLRVDSAYATWSNISGVPAWLSIGRRPSTGGIPSNLRQNTEILGTSGNPALLFDSAFDGLTVGFAPDLAMLPGSHVKVNYGKGYDSGYKTAAHSVKDTDFYAINIVPCDMEKLHVELLWQNARNMADAPSDAGVSTNLGDINWFGGVIAGKVENFHLFLTVATSMTEPNGNRFQNNPLMPGLLFDEVSEKHTGAAVYFGGRLDIKSSGTKIGAEYNEGSKFWMGLVPAGDDLLTSKLGARGSVIEFYLIQDIRNKPISKKGQAFFRVGYQISKYVYTGSNSWIGAPKKISDLDTTTAANAQMLAPVKEAKDLYLTFDVKF